MRCAAVLLRLLARRELYAPPAAVTLLSAARALRPVPRGAAPHLRWPPPAPPITALRGPRPPPPGLPASLSSSSISDCSVVLLLQWRLLASRERLGATYCMLLE